MAVFAVGVVLLLATMACHSDASYCLCNSNVGDEKILQKNIDYACGAGAECAEIHQNGSCFNPNTVKDHCNFAVNSYYQNKKQLNGSCDFSGSATVTQAPPSVTPGCVFPSTPSGGSSSSSSTVGLGPTTGGGIDSSSAAGTTILSENNIIFIVSFPLLLSLLVSGLMLPRII